MASEEAAAAEEDDPELPRRELGQFAVVGLYFVLLPLFRFHLATLAFVLWTLIGQARMGPWWAATYGAVLVFLLDRLAYAMGMHLPAASIRWY